MRCRRTPIKRKKTGLHYNWNRYYDPSTGQYLAPDPIGLEGGINLFTYALNNPVNWIDPWGLCALKEYNSGILLRILVPGQVAFDNLRTDFAQGNYVGTALNTVQMIGEQVLAVLTLGEGSKIVRSGERAIQSGTRYLFGKGGALNSNRYMRIGVGRKGGEKVFRISGDAVKKVKKNGHIDIFKMGKL